MDIHSMLTLIEFLNASLRRVRNVRSSQILLFQSRNLANQLKTRLYQAQKLNIFKLLAFATEWLMRDLVDKIFKDLPRQDMLILLRGQLREFFTVAYDDNTWKIEHVAKWVNNRLPAWERGHLFTVQSCNQLFKYVTANIDRPESVELLHCWLIESDEQ